MISVRFHRNFEKQFKKLSPRLREKFLERKDLFLQSQFHPLLNTHQLTGDRLGQWSMNISGDMRAIYEYADNAIVIFLEINTHSNLYT